MRALRKIRIFRDIVAYSSLASGLKTALEVGEWTKINDGIPGARSQMESTPTHIY
jgi:hypothetical protein